MMPLVLVLPLLCGPGRATQAGQSGRRPHAAAASGASAADSAGAAPYSALRGQPACYSALFSMPAFLTISSHFLDSSAWNFASSSGEVRNTSTPLLL